MYRQNKRTVYTLIYKATRDGDSPLIFHKKVDGIKNTLTLISTDSGYRCGGFVTKEWNTSGDFNKNDVDSFLFSLERKEKYMENILVKDLYKNKKQ